MIERWYNYFYNYEDEFPDSVRVWSGSFEAVYFAEKDDSFVLIYDGRLAIDFAAVLEVSDARLEEVILNPDAFRREHPLYRENTIQIVTFENTEERETYLQVNYTDKDKSKIVFERKLGRTSD